MFSLPIIICLLIVPLWDFLKGNYTPPGPQESTRVQILLRMVRPMVMAGEIPSLLLFYDGTPEIFVTITSLSSALDLVKDTIDDLEEYCATFPLLICRIVVTLTSYYVWEYLTIDEWVMYLGVSSFCVLFYLKD